MSEKTPTHDPISLEQLEFPRILEFLGGLLSTPYGAEQLTRLQFSCSKQEVERRLKEISEMRQLLDATLNIPLDGFTEIRPLLEKTRPQDAFLEPAQLMEINGILRRMGELASFFRRHQEDTPLLQVYAGRVHFHRELVQKMEKAIDPSGEVLDNASPELRKIRIRIRTLENEQKRELQKVQKRYADISQDEIVTLRDGRMVLGILPTFVNRVNGIVHGTSGSGATVFVEPMETLRLSNQIQNLHIQERTEIIKILKFLTGMISKVRDDIHYGLENTGRLDLLMAAARMSIRLNAATPHVVEEHFLKLANARHPLLLLKYDADKVVPLDVQLGKNFTTLVITGPNAGGKTVAMKTVGLLTLMVQLGLPIPADPDSVIPLLPRVLVDIGDRQSLEQDLSTFSAHVLRLKEVMSRADRYSLVLLDEMGTGTDPREGAALAIAMLSQLTERRALTIATTHHGDLKAFAHNHPRVENASMEFDLNTLQPTYRLRSGIPGSSYAFEISRRYGLPESLIEEARQRIGSEKDRLEKLLIDLESGLQKLEEQRRDLDIRTSEAKALKRLYEQREEELRNNERELRKQAAQAAQEILKEANATIERVVSEIRSSGASRASIKSARQAVKARKAEVAAHLSQITGAQRNPLSFEKGEIVRVRSLNETGELLDAPGATGRVRVLIGDVKMTVDLDSLEKVAAAEPREKPRSTVHGRQIDRLKGGVLPELDLRGYDAESALEATDRYLNEALESGWEEVRIVHGKGTGVLRRKIGEYLSRDQRVAEKRLGRWGEGDTGVTVVRLRND